jgi:hypothetical protein
LANEIMPNDPLARTQPASDIVEADYQTFCAALSASVRGRAFLAEYARRNRHADTEMVLAALERLQVQVRSQIAGPQAERIRQELRALLAAIRLTRPDADDNSAAIRATQQAALLGFVESRIAAIVAPPREHSVLPDEVAALVMPERSAEAARAALAVVPIPDEPELPIPAPAAATAREISLMRGAADMPNVTVIVRAPSAAPAAQPAVVQPVAEEPVAPTLIASPVAAVVEAAAPKAAAGLPPVDALAPIMALSEAERLALFT